MRLAAGPRRNLSRLLLAVAAVALLAAPAAARELSAEEKSALAERIATFDAAMVDSDIEALIDVVPPKVIATIAEGAGASEAQLREALIEQSREAMAAVELISFAMDLEAADYRQLPDGTPYVTIPTETVLDAGAGKTRVSTQTLALLETGRWYLVRIDDQQQVDILKAVYPEFSGVEFQPGTMEAVE
ncbi:MAG TPA: hypothetical protein VGN80_00680 [Devosiaceae bacterium]|jgi:hypothetical protein|nr:hypothetical protein [Devosiaceae bacterium]